MALTTAAHSYLYKQLRTIMKKYTLVFSLSTLLFFALSVRVFSQQSTWKASASSDKLVNPLSSNPTSAAEGKKIYESMCVICHGDKGKGNGAAGVSLTPRPANFLAITVRHETDGNIYWKLSEGNPPMASYKTLLSETQRWQLVNYIRQLENNSK
jgi:mono/diheme cytochrome c family protein